MTFQNSNFQLNLKILLIFWGANDVIDYYKINISEITIEELKKQINDKYKEELLKFKQVYNKFKNVHNIKFNEDEVIKYDEILKELIGTYIEFYNINMVETKEISLQKILNRAINKNKPFVGENGNSDKGFKDAVLWESIIEYARKSKNKKFILFTKNIQDFPRELEDEFESATNKKIEIINEISIIQEKILSEQTDIVKDMLTLNWLNENIQILIDKINDYATEAVGSNGYQIIDIERIEDLVNKGNDFYSFMIFDIEDGIEKQWYVEANYKNGELSIDDICMN